MAKGRKKKLGPPPSVRRVPIHPDLGPVLREWQRRNDVERAKVGKPPGGPLFPASPGSDEPWAEEEADAALAEMCRRAGLPVMTLDDIQRMASGGDGSGSEGPEALEG